MSESDDVKLVIDYAKNLDHKGRELGDELKRVPGLVDPNIIVFVAVAKGVGLCWECWKPLEDGPVGDYPLNSVGAWVRLHRECKVGAAKRYRTDIK